MSAYAELHCLSNFSFLRGASHPHELVETAHALGYRALALTDECSLAGIVRAHQCARDLGLQLLIGSEIKLQEGPRLVLLAPDRPAYTELCRLITRGRRAADKGTYCLRRTDLQQLRACLAIWLPQSGDTDPAAVASWLTDVFARRVWLGVELHCGPDDQAWLSQCEHLGRRAGIRLVACGDVHMHVRGRRLLQDTLTAIRHGCTLADAGRHLFPNGERHLRPRSELARLYPPALLQESCNIAARCRFSLNELSYQYPAEDLPPGMDANARLRALTEQGLRHHWPEGEPARVRRLIEKELALIAQLNYPHYFLTVHGIMQWARQQGILCQGRGSAANSAVCFALGITVVSPEKGTLLFERFISAERREPPDIDVDFEHQRREEVFQYIYRKYGRHRTALAATVVRYRPKSALRDVGKALGMRAADIQRINGALAWWDQMDTLPERLRELGFDPQSAPIRRLFDLVGALLQFPRHLSQHVGGFVISDQALDELVPIENAAMPERTVIQWDKDDLDAVGLFKVDCLALGMLTAIRKSLDLIERNGGQRLDIAGILASEVEQGESARQVFDMLCQGQSVGVFQVESRAQMAMLPRMRPRSLYDLTIETAIVRPGPIQGGMVHPYLQRRIRARQDPAYQAPCPERLRPILGRTHGIPIFQEQVMEVCVEGAGFAPGEADQVRRSMAAWGRDGYGKLERFERRLLEGFARNGIDAAFARKIYEQIKGFAEYGFPESHAASFAVLIYVSAWLKRFHPAAFLAGLLNSQPMGFYSASQLIQDFRRVHMVRVLPVDVRYSAWESSLESVEGRLAVRLGLNQVKGLGQAAGERVAKLSTEGLSLTQLFRRAGLNERERQALAAADALRGLSGDRHQSHWRAQGYIQVSDELPAPADDARLRPVDEGADIVADYASLGLSLRRHPLALLRERLTHLRAISTHQWRGLNHGRVCRVAGLVTHRQRPGTAKGIIFMTLEDEHGTANLVVGEVVLQRFRAAVLQARLLIAEGVNECRDGVRHLKVYHLEDRSDLLGRLPTRSRDFH